MLECASVLGGGKKNVILFTAFFLFSFFFFERARHAHYINKKIRHLPTQRNVMNHFLILNFEENRSKTNKTTPVWYRPAVQTMPSK